MTTDEIVSKTKESPALKHQSDDPAPFTYPFYWEGKVPLKVRMKQTVTSDLPMIFPGSSNLIAIKGNEYYCWVNSYGALSVFMDNGERLGLKPDEFEVTEFHTTD